MLFDDAMVIYSAQKKQAGYPTLRKDSNPLYPDGFAYYQSPLIKARRRPAMTQRGYEGLCHLSTGPFRALEIEDISLILSMGYYGRYGSQLRAVDSFVYADGTKQW